MVKSIVRALVCIKSIIKLNFFLEPAYAYIPVHALHHVTNQDSRESSFEVHPPRLYLLINHSELWRICENI